jgi:hypothetical protein
VTSSPDITPFVDLTVYDRDPHELVNRALQYLAISLPDWVPRVGNTEVLLLNGIAFEVAELVYAINRLPAAVLTALLKAGYQIPQDYGTPATATATFTAQDTLGYTIPAGTVVRLSVGSPTVPTLDFAVSAATSIPPGSSSVTAPLLATTNTDVANGVASGAALQLITQISWLNGAALASSPSGGLPPEDGGAYLARASGVLQRLTSTLVRPQDFLTAAATTPGIFRVLVVNNWAGKPWNLLSAADASFEGSVGDTTAFANCAVSSSTAQAEDGTHSLAMTATAIGTMSSRTASGSSAVPIVPGFTHTVRADYKAAATPQLVRTNVVWYDATGTLITSVLGTQVTDTTTGWTTSTMTVVAPSNAAYAQLGYQMMNAAAGEVHYVDEAGIFLGDNTNWAIPGGGVSGAGNITLYVFGAGGAYVPAATRATLQASLAAMASVNLNVFVFTATVTAVPVTVTVLRSPSVPAATVQANVTAAIEAYLSTDTWGAGLSPWPSTVKVAELTAVIDRAEGVDLVQTVTAPASDVTLPGIAPLATAGAITVTVAN